MRDLKTSLYLTIHGSKKSVEQIADECGITANYLYRSCLEGESGCRFPLDLLLPLMQATGDYQVLDHINRRTGRVTASAPRVRALKKKDANTVNEIQRNFNEAFSQFLKFWSTGDISMKRELVNTLHKHQCDVEAMKRAVADFEQGDLF